jgi:hypothetical protein
MGSSLAGSDSVKVTVKYDGPAIEGGRMDARDLAPAMLATAKLYEHVGALMYGSTTGLKIEVQANFREGSFAYDIVTRVAELTQHLIQNVSVSDVIATGTMLVAAVKSARGRKPKEIVPVPATGPPVPESPPQSKIVFHDGDVITVNFNVGQIFLNPTVREDVEGIVAPLKKEGIEDFDVQSPVGDVHVQKNEVDYFSAPLADEQVLQDKIEEEIVEVLSPHFKEGNKWQFSLAGEGVFWARILDIEFVRMVAARAIVFASGDALRVMMRVRVTRKPDGKFDRLREIIRVVGKEPGLGQGSLFE